MPLFIAEKRLWVRLRGGQEAGEERGGPESPFSKASAVHYARQRHGSAVALVIVAVFGAVVTSFVTNIMNPPITAIRRQVLLHCRIHERIESAAVRGSCRPDL